MVPDQDLVTLPTSLHRAEEHPQDGHSAAVSSAVAQMHHPAAERVALGPLDLRIDQAARTPQHPADRTYFALTP